MQMKATVRYYYKYIGLAKVKKENKDGINF